MEFKTSGFGVIHFEETDILTIRKGLLGFPDLTKFVFLKHPELEHVKWLQSIENPYIHFLLLSPFSVEPGYEIVLDKSIQEELGCKSVSEIAIYCIAVVPEDTKKSTLNLKAPVLINFTKGLAIQIISNKEEHSTKRPILEKYL